VKRLGLDPSAEREQELGEGGVRLEVRPDAGHRAPVVPEAAPLSRARDCPPDCLFEMAQLLHGRSFTRRVLAAIRAEHVRELRSSYGLRGGLGRDAVPTWIGDPSRMADTGSAPASRFRVVIAGGGVAALEAMVALRKLAEDRVELDLLAPEPHFWYRPLAVAEPYGLARVHRFELAALTNAVGASFILDGLASVDGPARVARTRDGRELPYDALLVALGAVPTTAIDGAVTFRGPADVEALGRLLGRAEEGRLESIAFVAPPGASWALPLYELALLTKAHLASRGHDVSIRVVTPERTPLAIFGEEAADAVGALLAERGIDITLDAHALGFADGRLQLLGADELEVDAVVALPGLRGPAIAGLPANGLGFIPADEHGRVKGTPGVYAAGDATAFPIKQGGLAAQQADAAAQSIAQAAGAPVVAEPFRAILRGLLLTGGVPRFIRTDLAGWGQHAFALDTDPLWWPPSKIAGKYLGPFLAEHGAYTAQTGPPPDGIPVEVDLGARIGDAV
jgi:sulfide:quinone oxidoreductase